MKNKMYDMFELLLLQSNGRLSKDYVLGFLKKNKKTNGSKERIVVDMFYLYKKSKIYPLCDWDDERIMQFVVTKINELDYSEAETLLEKKALELKIQKKEVAKILAKFFEIDMKFVISIFISVLVAYAAYCYYTKQTMDPMVKTFYEILFD
jgi:hypothetical protein